MKKEDIFKFILESNLSISKWQILISLLIALLIGLFIYFIYRVTYTGTTYSKNFGQSLVLMTIITTVIMTTIQSNLALSLGMVGSLSIIRFRTAIKEPRDIVFVFWSISAGVSCGAAVFLPGIAGSAVVGVMALVFSKMIYDRRTYLVVIDCISYDCELVGATLSKFSKNYCLKMTSSTSDTQQITYELLVNKKNVNICDLASELKSIEGVKQVNLVSYSGEMLG